MNKYTHKYNVILDNMDLDEYRLRPISAIMYVQDSFARYCATKKVAAYDLFPKNLYWIVSEFNINFTDKLPYWSEEIKTEIWISEITKLKIYTDFKIYYKDKEFAKGNGCWFILDMDSKRPAKTDIIAEKFDICNELVLGEHKKFALNDSKDKVYEIRHKNNLSDIDFNNHVNNKSYVNIAAVATTEDFKKTHSLESLSIKYIKESFLNDELVCTTYNTENQNIYIHKITKEGIDICDIQTSWTDKLKEETIIDYDLKVKSEN